MNIASFTQSRRVRRAAYFLYSNYRYAIRATPPPQSLPGWFAQTLAAVSVDQSSAHIAITDEGFITMALDLRQAELHDDRVAVPGCDSEGEFGFMVFHRGARPFHSRAFTTVLAVQEAQAAGLAAERLERHFGGREGLKRAAKSASIWQWCTLDDAQRAGLCSWGIETFLRRYRLLALTQRFGGLPKGIIWFGGSYVRRVVATAVMQRELQAQLDYSFARGSTLEDRTIPYP